MSKPPVTVAEALHTLGRSIADHDWATMRSVLADDIAVTYLHTGERFDAAGFVAVVRDYPGDWTFHVDEVVDGGSRGVLRSHTVIGDDTWHTASFASLDADGHLAEIVEIWSEAVAPHPDRSPPVRP